MVSKTILGCLCDLKWYKDLEQEKDDLNTTDDWESCQESHGASNQTNLGVKLDLLVFLYLVKSCRVKVYLHELKSRVWNFLSWNQDGPLCFPDRKFKDLR